MSNEVKGINNETDIAHQLITRWQIGHSGNWYFAVNLIARNLKVSPDIDLLRIYINQFHPEQNTAIGLELKVLKPRKYGDIWHINLGPFYQGLGQLLTYFEHGIDRAALVVGFHKNCTDHPNETKDAESLLKTHCAILKDSIFAAFPYLRIYAMNDGKLETLLGNAGWDEARFVPRSADAKLRRDSIFKMQFASKSLPKHVAKSPLGQVQS